jgi:hypothetical protein
MPLGSSSWLTVNSNGTEERRDVHRHGRPGRGRRAQPAPGPSWGQAADRWRQPGAASDGDPPLRQAPESTRIGDHRVGESWVDSVIHGSGSRLTGAVQSIPLWPRRSRSSSSVFLRSEQKQQPPDGRSLTTVTPSSLTTVKPPGGFLLPPRMSTKRGSAPSCSVISALYSKRPQTL